MTILILILIMFIYIVVFFTAIDRNEISIRIRFFSTFSIPFFPNFWNQIFSIFQIRIFFEFINSSFFKYGSGPKGPIIGIGSFGPEPYKYLVSNFFQIFGYEFFMSKLNSFLYSYVSLRNIVNSHYL